MELGETAQRDFECCTHVIGAMKIPNPLRYAKESAREFICGRKITHDTAVRNVVAEETICQGFETNPSYYDR